MTIGVGGSTATTELQGLTSRRDQAIAIAVDEYRERLEKLCEMMRATSVDAVYLDATTSLRYFTGMLCYASERLHGAIVSSSGELLNVCPTFEEQKTRAGMVVEGDFVLAAPAVEVEAQCTERTVCGMSHQRRRVAYPAVAVVRVDIENVARLPDHRTRDCFDLVVLHEKLHRFVAGFGYRT